MKGKVASLQSLVQAYPDMTGRETYIQMPIFGLTKEEIDEKPTI